jgi:hypothetical protein
VIYVSGQPPSHISNVKRRFPTHWLAIYSPFKKLSRKNNKKIPTDYSKQCFHDIANQREIVTCLLTSFRVSGSCRFSVARKQWNIVRGKGQIFVLELLMPLCRWLGDRAAGSVNQAETEGDFRQRLFGN